MEHGLELLGNETLAAMTADGPVELRRSAHAIGSTGGGTAFDHWNFQRLAGAISEICVIHGATPRVDQLEVHFAGTPVTVGGGGNRRNCFTIGRGEVITRVNVRADGRRVHMIQFVTDQGRTSQQFGSPTAGIPGTIHAPTGMHLMSFWGHADRSPSPFRVNSIGFWWGRGGGSASWEVVQSCVGCSAVDYRISECSTESGNQLNRDVQRWSTSVTTELSFGFSALRFGLRVENSWSRETVRESSSAFSRTTCVDRTFRCDRRHLFQWVFRTNFDNRGHVTTRTNLLLCTDNPRPCCLPMSTSDGNSCDLDPAAPSECR